jgi:hypothetical protein
MRQFKVVISSLAAEDFAQGWRPLANLFTFLKISFVQKA